ncbi:unnamed protein product [Ceutorhynchus assimilis]|uniref:Uncharacterized protein n=1 Tax=Ceutorhynchus assimilis TaxID=467358 RepID=A0A9N9MH26_9CUCU|nr:unnamed protein product [Ceutorhynchus assimilis]
MIKFEKYRWDQIPWDLNTFTGSNHNEGLISTVPNDDISYELDMPDLPDLLWNDHVQEPETGTEKLVLHRGNIFRELIDAVKNRNIRFSTVQVEMILPNGKPEEAEDVGGVLRDCISEFFASFYEMGTMGAELKVPALRHDFQKEEWSAVGKIIAESFLSESYFPIKIAPIFIEDCFGHKLSDKHILDNFLRYISESEATLLKNALENFDEVDFDEVLEFSNNYAVKCLPTKENFKQLLLQVATAELIQKPSFVKECFRPHFNTIKDLIDIQAMYTKYQPTAKNMISMVELKPNLSVGENKIVEFLKKYVKECDQKTRSALLRFVTGSDMANKKITIDFSESDGFARTSHVKKKNQEWTICNKNKTLEVRRVDIFSCIGYIAKKSNVLDPDDENSDNVEPIEANDDTQGQHEEEENALEDDQSNSALNSQGPRYNKSFKSNRKNVQKEDDGVQKVITFLNKKESNKNKNGELDYFFASACESTKNLPRYLQLRVKQEIMDAIIKAESEYLNTRPQ